MIDGYDVVLVFFVFEIFYWKEYNTLTCIHHFIHFQGILQADLMPWLRILVSLKQFQPREGRAWCRDSFKRIMHKRTWMIMTAGLSMSRLLRHSEGTGGALWEWWEVAHPSTCLPRSPLLEHHPHLLGRTPGSHFMPDLLFSGKQRSDTFLFAIGP